MNGEEPMTFMMLPNDLVLNCLARISRSYYPALSLVSKKFRSLLASTELYQTRNLLGRTEICLYVCLKLPSYSSSQQWFILCRRPKSSKKVLVPITSPNSPCTYQSGFARAGTNIYAIGGFMNNDNVTSSVMVMDCRSHTWREAPSMKFARLNPTACVLDEKIYVTGGCHNLDATNWMEVFDTKTQTWEFESSSADKKICSGFRYRSLGYDGNIYVKSFPEHVIYKLNKGRWRAGDIAMNQGWFYQSSYCVIENVLYSGSSGIIMWYDSQNKWWEYLEGMDDLLRLPHSVEPKVADNGGNLVVLWEDNEGHPDKIVWCAEISLKKCQEGKIWGTLVWLGDVATTNEPYNVVHVLAATL